MASQTVLLPLLLLAAAAAAADDIALAPSPTPATNPNLTTILETGGQYTTLLHLLQTTKIAEQLHNQLKNSYDGLTFFAPNDAAFTKVKPGTLNALSEQQKIQLLLYHVLPRYYSVSTFQTASNPLPTEASGPGGMYSVNVTASTTSHIVNMSTGVVDVPISSTMVAQFPLAVYSVDDVLLPVQMFGTSATESHKAAAAQAPAGQKEAGRKKGGVPKSDVAAEPSAAGEEEEEDGGTKGAACRGVMSAGWMMVAAFSLVAAVNLVGA